MKNDIGIPSQLSDHDLVAAVNSLARCEREPTAKFATPGSVAPLGVDRSHAELSPDLVREDDPAGRRSGDRIRRERSRPPDDRGAEALCFGRVLQDLELLQIQGRVPPRREDEVPFAERTRVPENALHVGSPDRHRDYSARG